MNSILLYFLIIILFIILDAPYLYLNFAYIKSKAYAISGKDYTKRYYSALIVYLALALGILVLVLPRIINKTTWQNRLKDSIIYGGTFGLASYATFDFTMHFMFDGWDLNVSIMDSIWGSVLCSIIAFIVSYVN